jgi:hypothetical protein
MAIQSKRGGVLVHIQLLALKHCWSTWTGSCLTTLILLQQWWVDGTCQNMAELTGGRLLWHRHTETYSPMCQVPQFPSDYVEK